MHGLSYSEDGRIVTVDLAMLALAWPETCANFEPDSTQTYPVCRHCGKSERNHHVRAVIQTISDFSNGMH